MSASLSDSVYSYKNAHLVAKAVTGQAPVNIVILFKYKFWIWSAAGGFKKLIFVQFFLQILPQDFAKRRRCGSHIIDVFAQQTLFVIDFHALD